MIQTVLLSIFVPALIAGPILLLLTRIRNPAAPLRQAGGAIALALGFIAGQMIILGKPAFPPIDGTSWLPYLAGIAMIAGFICAIFFKKPKATWIVAALIAASVPYLLLQTQFKYTWSAAQGKQTEGILNLVALFIAMLLIWKCVDHAVRTVQGVAVPLALLMICATTSAVIVLGESALVGQLAGCLAGALGAAVVLAFVVKDFTIGIGTTVVFVTLLVGFLINGYFYANVPLPSALLLLAAPLMLAIGTLDFTKKLCGWKAVLVRLALVALPLAIAVALALQKALSKPSAMDY